MRPNPQFSADLVTFTEEIFNEILHFLCSSWCKDLGSKKLRLTFLSVVIHIEAHFPDVKKLEMQ